MPADFFLLRKKLYKEIYDKHSKKSKISKLMYYQPINNWKKNPYLKLKYFYIIEIANLISFLFIKKNYSPNILTLVNIKLALISFVCLSLPILELNYLSLLIFFSKNIIDYSDGFVARNLKKTSTTGMFLDEWSGFLFYCSFYFSVPIYVYNNTQDLKFIIILILILFFNIINPKLKILSYDFLKKLKKKEYENITHNFMYLSHIKTKKKISFKESFVKILSMLDYSGRTRYTDLVIVLIFFEIFFNFIFFTKFICLIWFLMSLLKMSFFTSSILKLNI